MPRDPDEDLEHLEETYDEEEDEEYEEDDVLEELLECVGDASEVVINSERKDDSLEIEMEDNTRWRVTVRKIA